MSTIHTTQDEALTRPATNTIWLNLVNRLLDSNYLINVEVESNNSLIPIPWPINDKLSIPYGSADTSFLKKLLYSSDCLVICKSLQALIERAYDCFKTMDMLRLDVLTPLNRLTRLAEPFIRQRCCVLIRVLAGQPLGKVSVVRNAVLVGKLLALMADDDYRVRFHGAAAVMALASHRPGNEDMVELGCADRVMERVCTEQDGRVMPCLLSTVGMLMATNRTVRERVSVDFSTFIANGRGRSAVTDALVHSGGLQRGRGLLDYLKRGAHSPDYRTALDSVVCMSRAATVREANEYLARDRGTVAMLVSFASSPELRGRALRAFSAQLLCMMAGTSAGLKHLRAAMATTENCADLWGWTENDDPATRRYLDRLADIVPLGSFVTSSPNVDVMTDNKQ